MTEQREAALPELAGWLEPHIQHAAFAVDPWVKQRKVGLNLASNEFVHPVVDQLVEEAMRSLPARRISAYADPQELVEVLAGRLGLPVGRVLVTAGSDDAIRCLAAAVFRSTGRLVLQEPNYDLVRKYAELNGVAVHGVGLARGAYRFEIASIVDTVRHVERDGPAVAYVSNPNGPVGSCFPLTEMRELADHCADRGHLLVVDEAYVPYNGFDHLALLHAARPVVLVRSFSKSLGTAGGRVGMVAADEELIAYLRRWYPMNPLSGPAIHLMRFLLEHEVELAAARAEIVDTRDWFAAEIAGAIEGWTAVPSDTNFVNFDVGDPALADEVAARLRARAVHVRPMRAVPGLERCLRVTVADRATMERVVEELVTAARAAGTERSGGGGDGHA
jgi:histidinol-phosphate aminotransferase